jgi:hypothetical protein
LNEVSDDNISQGLNTIHQNRTIDSLMRTKKGRQQKNMGMFTLNKKSYILHDRHKGIPHNIIGNHPFFTMGVIKNMDPHKV